ncbi:SDR family NAD(P)-dependent oxidoreductase [Oceanicella sp. SM1341]|uniref:SDR family NAD(P)-dependent oxidoreductase n=1 Tax=Oceanicella sp. SM1341 TaxID=1548889 RepID=UPI000E49CAD6|nr:SDR family NAD(P)-dependent oxidoreductase [Oceanicella sp. SM1341]
MAHPAIAEGNVAVVTGGASGIGLAAAQAFAAAGMRVVIADLPGAAPEQAAERLAAGGARVIGHATDVTRPQEIAGLKAAADALGRVSVLMNNAGREGGGRILAPEPVWRDTLETNLWGVLHGIRAFVPDMIAAGGPAAVVCTGSKQGITLPPGDTAYNVSKAALKALTESLSHDLVQETGGRVSAHLLIPGFTWTGFTRRRGVAARPDAAWTPEQVAERLLAGMAAGDFYILCPDGETDRETDLRRMRWSFGDILENRPALSRWHPEHAGAFRAWMAGEG